MIGNEYNSGTVGEYLNTRWSGEYVNFDGDKYRIVSTEDSITKLTRVDYLRSGTSVINKNFASTAYFGKSTNTQADTYWDYYLNNTWYNSISSTYKSMMVNGTYYLGLNGSNYNYKKTICKNSDSELNSKVIKMGESNSCTRYTSSDTDKTFVGKVGLQRVGEMFSSQLGSDYSTSDIMWLITPFSSSNVRNIYNSAYLNNNLPESYAYGARPSINLKSSVKILSGSGTELDPYIVG